MQRPHFDVEAAKKAWARAGDLVEARALAETEDDFRKYQEGPLTNMVTEVVGDTRAPEEVQLRIGLFVDALAFWASAVLWAWARDDEDSQEPPEAKVRLLLQGVGREIAEAADQFVGGD